MLFTTNLGDFLLYIFDESNELDNIDIDPFCYQFKLKYEDGAIVGGNGTCCNIPCELCTISVDCHNGKAISKSLFKYIDSTFTELKL